MHSHISSYYLQAMGVVRKWKSSPEYYQKTKMNYVWKAIVDAKEQLSEWGFKLAESNIYQSICYTYKKHESYYEVIDRKSRQTTQIITFKDRCECEIVRQYNGFQCMHEFCIYQEFKKRLILRILVYITKYGKVNHYYKFGKISY